MTEKREPIPFSGTHSSDDLNLYGAYQMLLPIWVEGEPAFVPENNSVLRCLQYLELKENSVRMDWGRYCWNNTKGCCEMEYRAGADRASTVGRACQVRAISGLEILQLPRGGRKLPR